MQRGFSLVELSIVLVILGLLTGGILAGQSLIRAAEMRAVTNEYMRYQTALNMFRDKYFQIAGDITNATNFWGNIAGNSSDNYTTSCYSVSSPDTRTCNGNGDGMISQYEREPVWKHLANAGLIEGSYIGINNPTAPYFVPGVTDPGSRIHSSAAWIVQWINIPPASGYWAGNAYGYGGQYDNRMWLMNAAFVTPSEAWNIDMKLDDGKPAVGKVYGTPGVSPSPCSLPADTARSAADANDAYNLPLNEKVCTLTFLRVT